MTLIMIIMSGGLISSSITVVPIPLDNKEACITASKVLAENSGKSVGFICVSRVTGETILTRGKK